MFRSRLVLLTLALVAAIYAVRWQQGEAVAKYSRPIAQLLDDRSNPTELTFSGRRARLCKVMAILTEAREDSHLGTDIILKDAAEQIHMSELMTETLIETIDENLLVAKNSGLLDGESLAALKAGELPLITNGPFTGDRIDFEYAIDIDKAPMLETHFANLVLQPTYITENFGVRFTERSQRKADHFYRANLISQDGYFQLASSATEEPASW